MKAYRIFKEKEGIHGRFVDMTPEELTPGEVLVEVHYSSVNYKDALCGFGVRPIPRKFPLNGGIDLSGKILESTLPQFKVGSWVLCNGAGLSETNDGGYSELSRLTEDMVVEINENFAQESMTLGTAGFTAALALHQMELNGQKPEMGPIVITGASGGVGSVATALFSQQGYEVWSVSGKSEAKEYLVDLGAHKVLTMEELSLGSQPLGKGLFAGVVDSIGGHTLGGLLAHIKTFGNLASIGHAQAPDFQSTVLPHILRGVNLLGISSANTPIELRRKIWSRLGESWRIKGLDKMPVQEIRFSELETAFQSLLDRKNRGRYILKIRG